MVDFFGETILHADTAIIVLQYHNCVSCIRFFFSCDTAITLTFPYLFFFTFWEYALYTPIRHVRLIFDWSFIISVCREKRWLWLCEIHKVVVNLMSDTRCFNRCCLSSTWFVICRVKSKTPNYFQSRSSAFPLMRKTSAHYLNLCLRVTEFIILRCSN